MKKLLLAAGVLVALTGTGMARTVEQQLISSLQKQGYVVLEQGYTFLGRLRIVAGNGEFRREIVVNPGTGEILRDYAVSLTNRTTPEGGTSSASSAPPVVSSAAPFDADAGDGTAATVGTTALITPSASGAADDVTVTSGPDDTAQPGPDLSTGGGAPELVLPDSVLPLGPAAP